MTLGKVASRITRRRDIPVARPPKGLAEDGFGGNAGVALGCDAGVEAPKVGWDFAVVADIGPLPTAGEVSAGVDSGCCFACWGCDGPCAKGDFAAAALFAASPVADTPNTVLCMTSGSVCDVRLLSTIVSENV